MPAPLLYKQILNNQWDEALIRLEEYQRSGEESDGFYSLDLDGNREEYEESRDQLLLPLERELTYIDVGGWTCLHLACSLEATPPNVIRALCDVFPEARALSDSEGGSTPLHIAIWDGNTSTVQELLHPPVRDKGMLQICVKSRATLSPTTSNAILSIKDWYERTPLDLLCEAYSALLEEGVDESLPAPEDIEGITAESLLSIEQPDLLPVYSKGQSLIFASAKARSENIKSMNTPRSTQQKTLQKETSEHEVLDQTECATTPTTPILHACVSLYQDQICPLNFLNLVVKLFPHQLAQPDKVGGNLPLHLAAMYLPCSSSETHDSSSALIVAMDGIDSIYASVEELGVREQVYDVFQLLIQAYPQAARVRNGNGWTPFECAVKSRRGWKDGCQLLLEAYPEAVEHLKLADSAYPHVFSFVGHHTSNVGTLYGIIRSKPSLCCNTNNE
jgi:ankyrin repeat protein